EAHVTLITVAEVSDSVFGPLIRFCKQHPVAETLIDPLPEMFQKHVRLRKVFAVGPVALVQVGDGIQSHSVDTHSQPKIDNMLQASNDVRMLEIEVGLMMVEPVPVILVSDGIPRPVRRLEVFEDNAGILVLFRIVTPDVELSSHTSRFRAPGTLKPLMLVGCVI